MNKAISTSAVNARQTKSPLSSVLLSYDTLFEALTSASEVSTHYGFNQWLQQDVQALLPHETLVAVWGDFAAGEFNYDLTSSVPGIKSSVLERADQLNSAMLSLWHSLQSSEQNWMVVEDFCGLGEKLGLNMSTPMFKRFSENVEAVLVFGLRCNRGPEDCLYIFSLTDMNHGIDPSVLNVLISHVDASLRRVARKAPRLSSKHFAQSADLQQLSAREREVMRWVGEGKSNEEIGLILEISRNTVKNHLKRIFNKLGVSSRSQAVRRYMNERTVKRK